jgi:hypothetical protein
MGSLFIESFDLRSSNQYILVKAVPSCFREIGNIYVDINASMEPEPPSWNLPKFQPLRDDGASLC